MCRYVFVKLMLKKARN